MIEFVGGLLGSAHCIGMCGPLAISLGASAPAGVSPMLRQLVFSLGRIVTYGFCGAVAGFGGAWVSASSSGVVLLQAWLAVAAGIVLLLMGLVTAGVLPRPATVPFATAPCGAVRGLKTFLASPQWTAALLAGVFTGFILCRLVYAFLVKAGSTGGVVSGWLTMAVFGLGSVPLMVLTGVGGQYLSGMGRVKLFRLAAWCIVLTGAISIVRGTAQLQAPANQTAATAYPLCASQE